MDKQLKWIPFRLQTSERASYHFIVATISFIELKLVELVYIW